MADGLGTQTEHAALHPVMVRGEEWEVDSDHGTDPKCQIEVLALDWDAVD